MAMTQTMMTLHRWLGLVGGALIMVAASTALGLNHAEAIKGWVAGRGPSEGPYADHLLAVAEAGGRVLVGNAGGLFASDDRGAHWTAVLDQRVGSLAVKGDAVYATVGADSLMVSRDAGRHWATALKAETELRAVSVDAAGRLLVASNAGLYREAAVGEPAAPRWTLVPRPVVPGAERGRAVQGWLERLHMGDVWGRFGVPVTDVVAISLDLLVLTGYFLFIGRAWKIRQARRKVRITMAAKAAAKPVPAAV